MSLVYYKARLILPSESSEVRKFAISADVATSITYLQQKLQLIFPQLSGQKFDILWIDSENDEVTIGSDDELSLALASLSHDLKKIIVRPKQRSITLNVNVMETECEKKGLKRSLRRRVICDVCESTITRFRYKCLQCVNYDLCEKCEANHNHPEHMMIRLEIGTIPHEVFREYWKKVYFLTKNLVKEVHKSSRSHSLDQNCDSGNFKSMKHNIKRVQLCNCGEFEYNQADGKKKWGKKRKVHDVNCIINSVIDFLNSCDTYINPMATKEKCESATVGKEIPISTVGSTVDSAINGLLKTVVNFVQQGLSLKTVEETVRAGNGPSTSPQNVEEETGNEETLDELTKNLAENCAFDRIDDAGKAPVHLPSTSQVQLESTTKTNLYPSIPTDPKIEHA